MFKVPQGGFSGSCRAIVTGHSRGLGRALATALAAQGLQVLGLSRQAVTDIPGIQSVPLDLSDAQAVYGLIASETFTSFCTGSQALLLINNAGVVAPMGPLGSLEAQAMVQALTVNVTAPLLLSNAVAAWGAECRPVRILHVSSGAGRTGYPGWSTYCASKAALDHHARSAQADALPHVKVCSVAPGVVDTDMQAQLRASDAEQFRLKERFIALKEAGQLSTPEEAAGLLVKHVLSDAFGLQPVLDVRDFD